jgi:hypothetical protein
VGAAQVPAKAYLLLRPRGRHDSRSGLEGFDNTDEVLL